MLSMPVSVSAPAFYYQLKVQTKLDRPLIDQPPNVAIAGPKDQEHSHHHHLGVS